MVESTTPLLPAYDRLFGIVQVTTTDAVAAIHVGRHRLVFSTPDDFQTMHPALDLACNLRLPGIVALEIAVEQREVTAAHLAGQKIAFAEMPGGGLAVAADQANGAILIFSES